MRCVLTYVIHKYMYVHAKCLLCVKECMCVCEMVLLASIHITETTHPIKIYTHLPYITYYTNTDIFYIDMHIFSMRRDVTLIITGLIPFVPASVLYVRACVYTLLHVSVSLLTPVTGVIISWGHDFQGIRDVRCWWTTGRRGGPKFALKFVTSLPKRRMHIRTGIAKWKNKVTALPFSKEHVLIAGPYDKQPRFLFIPFTTHV